MPSDVSVGLLPDLTVGVDSPLQKAPGLSMFCLHTSHTRFFLKLFSVKA